MTPKDLLQWGLSIAFVIFAIGYAAALVRKFWRDEP